MFNFLSIFSFLKKKTIKPPKSDIQEPKPVVEKQIQIDDIAIHAMPERFRHQPIGANSARTTGLLIIGGGAVVLILASTLLYVYLFKQPAAPVKPEPPVTSATSTSETTQIQPAVEPIIPNLATSTATTTEPAVLPVDNSLATSTATSTPETVALEPAPGLIPGLDSDHDGLTDAEEILLKTSTSTPDTDGDGYLDGAELLNLYDPAGPGKLTANSNIAIYENKTFNYSALYPIAWQLTSNGGDDSIMFKTADNQFVQIIVQANAAQQSLDQWYLEQLGAVMVNDADRISGSNWQGIKSLDGLTWYLMDSQQKYIFTLAYNPGENNILEYADIFKMMIKSFILK